MLSLFIIIFKSADYITTGLKTTLLWRAADPRGHLFNIFLTNFTTHEQILNKNLSIASLMTKSFFFFFSFQIFKSLSKAFVKYPKLKIFEYIFKIFKIFLNDKSLSKLSFTMSLSEQHSFKTSGFTTSSNILWNNATKSLYKNGIIDASLCHFFKNGWNNNDAKKSTNIDLGGVNASVVAAFTCS